MIKRKILTLKAEFKFSKEAHHPERDKLLKRLSCAEGGGLRDYLINEERLQNGGSITLWARHWDFYDKNRKITIIESAFSQYQFDLIARAKKDIPLEKIIDLDALNHFVLTGQCEPEKIYTRR